MGKMGNNEIKRLQKLAGILKEDINPYEDIPTIKIPNGKCLVFDAYYAEIDAENGDRDAYWIREGSAFKNAKLAHKHYFNSIIKNRAEKGVPFEKVYNMIKDWNHDDSVGLYEYEKGFYTDFMVSEYKTVYIDSSSKHHDIIPVNFEDIDVILKNVNPNPKYIKHFELYEDNEIKEIYDKNYKGDTLNDDQKAEVLEYFKKEGYGSYVTIQVCSSTYFTINNGFNRGGMEDEFLKECKRQYDVLKKREADTETTYKPSKLLFKTAEDGLVYSSGEVNCTNYYIDKKSKCMQYILNNVWIKNKERDEYGDAVPLRPEKFLEFLNKGIQYTDITEEIVKKLK
jgi:hypothetical protein